MRVLACLLALAACNAPSKQVPLESHTTEPAPRPTGPAPSIVWTDNGFDTPGLPAVTADGKLVVTAEIEEDGGRGNPNLRLVSRDRSDAILERITILKTDEVDDMFDHEGRHPKLDARISAANTWLAKLHASSALVALPKLEVDGHDAFTQHAATSGKVSLDWQHDQVHIGDGTKVVVVPSSQSWYAPDQNRCKNPAKLGAAWVDVTRRVALVEIAYNGDDMCWQPSAQHHVMVW